MKTWFVSYRPRLRRTNVSHPTTSQTFETEAEAKAFARTLDAAENHFSAGTINPHQPKKFFGARQIADWLASDNKIQSKHRREHSG
jgi:hypothetical protein